MEVTVEIWKFNLKIIDKILEFEINGLKFKFKNFLNKNQEALFNGQNLKIDFKFVWNLSLLGRIR